MSAGRTGGVAGSGSAWAESEAGDDLVEDEQRAGLLGLFAEGLDPLRSLDEEAAVGGDPLDEDRGDLAPALGEERADRVLVVEGEDDGRGGEASGDAG